MLFFIIVTRPCSAHVFHHHCAFSFQFLCILFSSSAAALVNVWCLQVTGQRSVVPLFGIGLGLDPCPQ
eukprot:203659-Hanusia_phi.AAC.1